MTSNGTLAQTRYVNAFAKGGAQIDNVGAALDESHAQPVSQALTSLIGQIFDVYGAEVYAVFSGDSRDRGRLCSYADDTVWGYFEVTYPYC